MPKTDCVSAIRAGHVALWAMGFVLLWATIIQIVEPPIEQTQNQYTGNLQEAEAFVYGESSDSPMVVGSSMAEFMDTLSGGRVAELSMNGMSAREALEVIVRSGRVPSRIAVEVNGLTAPHNQGFVDHLFAPVFHRLRRSILALRAEYQPASVVMSYVKRAFGQRRTESEWGVPSSEFVELRVKQLNDQYQAGPEMKVLESNLRAVRELVDSLEQRGARVLLYDLPVPHGLGDTPFHRIRREATERILSTGRSEAVYHFPDADYETKDGIHLTRQGQQAIANRLADMLGARHPEGGL
jgi:hypothetical protein